MHQARASGFLFKNSHVCEVRAVWQHRTQTRDCWCCGRRLMSRRSASGKTPRSPSRGAQQNVVQTSKAPRPSCLTEKDGETCLVCAKPRKKTVCKRRGQLERAAAGASSCAL